MQNCKYLLFIFFSLTIRESIGQVRQDSILHFVSAKFQYTSILASGDRLQQFTKNHPWFAEIDLSLLKNTQKSWSYCNCYMQNGVSLGYIDFSNPSKLGHAFTVSVFTDPTLLSTKRFRLSLRGNIGLAFLNKVYNRATNPDAIFFSEKISFLLGLGVNSVWQINPYLKIRAIAQFNHISNGGRKDPNEGMNFPGLGVGLDFGWNPQLLQKRKSAQFRDKSLAVILHGFGNQRTAPADGVWPEEKRLVIGANAGIIKRISRVNGIGVGGELYYDGINASYQQRTGQIIQTMVSAVNIQHHLFLGKLLFGQQMAWYVTPNTGSQAKIYQRYFIEYEVRKNWYAGFTLKATADQSDYMGFSVGHLIKL